jgi:hypothetical protein
MQHSKAHDKAPAAVAAPDLVANIRAIKAEIARLQGLLNEASAELNGASAQGAVAARRLIPSKKPGVRLIGGNHPAMELVAGSAASLAADVIRAAGRPLHVRDLVKGIEERGGQKVKEATLVGALSRWVKRKAIFYRAGKNTFGLIEMRRT